MKINPKTQETLVIYTTNLDRHEPANILSQLPFNGFIFRALKVLDAIQVALFNYFITFIVLLVAATWLGEKLNTSAIIGGTLVFASTLIIIIVDYRINHEAAIKPLAQ